MAIDLKDPEVKAALKEAVDTAVEEATTGLNAKNKELLGKLKAAQKNAEIDPSDHAALQQELSETETKLAEANKALKIATKAAEDSKKLYDTEAGVTHNLLVDKGLNAALIENGVKNATYLKAAIALMKGQVKLEADGDNRIAKVGDKTLADHVKEWAGTDEGKAFVDAPGNAGGGAPGGAGGGEAKGKFEDITDPAARLTAIGAEVPAA